MRILIVGLIFLALSVAGISTYLIQNLSPESIEELEKKDLPSEFQILVAVRPLSPGEKVIADAIAWREWPEDGLSDQYIKVQTEVEKDAQTKQVVGSVARAYIQAGEPVLKSKLFKSDAPGFMAGLLDKGTRAFSISVNLTTGVAGFILPGNYVDVIIVHGLGATAEKTLKKDIKKKDRVKDDSIKAMDILSKNSETVLQNIKVLAVNQSAGKVEGQTIVAKTLTLQLTPKQVEILNTARAMGKISVALRDISASGPKELEEAITFAGTFTTDVETSPYLKNLNRNLLNLQKTREQILNEQLLKLKKEQLAMERASREQLDTLSKEKEQAILDGKQRLAEQIKKLEAQKLQELEAQRIHGLEANKKSIKKQAAPKQAKIVAKKPTVRTVPVKKKSSVITIYRGGASKTQEIRIK